MNIIQEATKVKRSIAIVDGKKVMKKEIDHAGDELPEGYKRDKDGRKVKMSQEERRNRSKAASKSANDPKTKRNKKISDDRRKLMEN